VGRVSGHRRRPPPTRWPSTPARPPANPFTGLAKRCRRRNGDPRCRSVHVPGKPERRPDPRQCPCRGALGSAPPWDGSTWTTRFLPRFVSS